LSSSDPAFREALIWKAVEAMLAGEEPHRKTILRDCIKATDDFEKLPARDRHAGEEPHPHVRAAGQSAGAQSVRRDRLFAEPRRAHVASHQRAGKAACAPRHLIKRAQASGIHRFYLL